MFVRIDARSADRSRRLREQVEIQAKYEGYIERQRDEVERSAAWKSRGAARLTWTTLRSRGSPPRCSRSSIEHRPETIGQAARISGVTPAAISLLLVHLKRGFGADQNGMTPHYALHAGADRAGLDLPQAPKRKSSALRRAAGEMESHPTT